MMHFNSNTTASLDLISDLETTLLGLNQNPYPHVPNPPGCKKRAATACIIRIRPSYADSIASSSSQSNTTTNSPSSPKDTSFAPRLSAFFSHPTTQRGTPEILFIKRAPRVGDRFTSHVAFPGGKRDPEDASDLATAIRETREEVGLDLAAPGVLVAGNLPERIVTAEWGRTPLMVLCPFVFVLTDDYGEGSGGRKGGDRLKLQPAEIASAHWVPLHGLMRQELNCFERAEVSDRLAGRRGVVVRTFLRVALGQMLFAATRLVPTESVWSSEAVGFMPEVEGRREGFLRRFGEIVIGSRDHGGSSNRDRPLKLWGLTYGCVADLLDLLKGHELKKSWAWPTVTQWDMRIMIWLCTWRLRKERMAAVRPLTSIPPIIVDEGVGTLGGWKDQTLQERASMEREMRIARSSAVGHMLKGYFERFRRGVILALVLRGVVGATVGVVMTKRYLRNRQSRL